MKIINIIILIACGSLALALNVNKCNRHIKGECQRATYNQNLSNQK